MGSVKGSRGGFLKGSERLEAGCLGELFGPCRLLGLRVFRVRF